MRSVCQHLGGVTRLAEGLPIYHCSVFGDCSEAGTDSTAICDTDCSGFSQFDRSSTCRYRGEAIRQDTGNVCGARGDQIDVFGCDLYRECCVRRYCRSQSVRICLHCSDFDDGSNPITAKFKSTPNRHLIFHIWPKRGNGVWQWNVQELLKRIELFDGKRIIGIATSDDTDSVKSVQDAFLGHRIDDWVVRRNDPIAGEGVTFVDMLELLPKDSGVTFYGHAKGVKHGDHRNVRRWTSIMYRACLDGRDACLGWLERFPMVGSLRTCGFYAVPNCHDWHYAGTFFWFRNRDVFAKPNWPQINKTLYGCVEVWPGMLFESRNTACVVGDKSRGSLYEGAGLDACEKLLDRSRTSLSVVIPTLGRKSLLKVFKSLYGQLGVDDEILIIADGNEAGSRVESMLRSWLAEDPRIRLEIYHDERSAVGNAQRNYGQSIAKGDWVWFVDDDDRPAIEALETIISRVRTTNVPTIFRINHLGIPIWRMKEVALGNVSSQSLVVPNSPMIPRFPITDNYAADFDWIKSVSDAVEVDWCEDVVYSIERHAIGAA